MLKADVLNQVQCYKAFLPIGDLFDIEFLFLFCNEPGVQLEAWTWFHTYSGDTSGTKTCMRRRGTVTVQVV